jgi:hypothetical protein
MRFGDRLLLLLLGATTAAFLTGACKKSAETKQEASEVELYSAQRSTEANRKVVDEKNARFAVVRREQLELRARLQEQIDEIDRKLAALKVEFRNGGYVPDPRSRGTTKIDELLERRRQLEDDASVVERADEHGWDDVKVPIENHLKSARLRGRI